MADHSGDASSPAVGQQGQTASQRPPQDPKQAKPGERRQSKGKQPNKRGGKPSDSGTRPAEVGVKGTGFIKLVKDSFGFISSPDLDEHLFFHTSEVLPPEGHDGPPIPFKDAVAAGDEVEFVVGQNTGKRSNHVAKQVEPDNLRLLHIQCARGKQVKKLPVHSVKAQLLSKERYLGRITRELNSGQWRSEESSAGQIAYQPSGEDAADAFVDFTAQDARQQRRLLGRGAQVEFNICTDNQTGETRAVHIEVKAPPKGAPDAVSGATNGTAMVLHGFIKSMKPQSGVIRCIERDERLTFKKADVAAQHQERLAVGAEVVFTAVGEGRGGAPAVAGLMVLAPGTLVSERVTDGLLQGRVVRPIASAGAERPEEGLIAVHGAAEAGQPSRVPFRAGPLEGSAEDAASLRLDDEVEFRLVTDLRADAVGLRGLRVACRAAQQRELGQIRTLKGNFGFIRCCQRSGDLFFHYTTLQGCAKEDLKKGDDVEFTVERSPEHGTIAVRVCQMPPGSAVFETVSEDEHSGVVLAALQQISPQAVANGVISFQEAGQPAKIMFGEHDIKDKVSAGDHVSFRIANNVNAAKQAEKLGGTISKLVGRRATQGALLRLSGTVRQVKGSYGFIQAAAPGASERSVFFHSSEVRDGTALAPGDEVAFGLTTNPKTQEVNARRVQRTKEAPEGSPPTPEVKPPAERSSPAPGAPTVRMAAMPDGTRGFTLGRGTPLKPPYPALVKASAPVEISAGKPVPGRQRRQNGALLGVPASPLARSLARDLGRAHSRSLPSMDRLLAETKPGSAEAAAVVPRGSLLRTSSALNPSAPSFMPKTPL